jgi:poly(hydroxyalkanoate) granule-associated protein
MIKKPPRKFRYKASGGKQIDQLETRKQIMVKKLKGLAGAMSGNQLAATVCESAQQIWLAGLGAYSTAQAQGSKVFDALVKQGEAIQPVLQKAVESGFKEAAAKAAGTRSRLERVFEDSAARSLKRFGVPTRKDVDTLSKRVLALSALIDRMTQEVSRKRTASKPAAARRR